MPAIIFDCGIERELYVDCEQLLIVELFNIELKNIT